MCRAPPFVVPAPSLILGMAAPGHLEFGCRVAKFYDGSSVVLVPATGEVVRYSFMVSIHFDAAGFAWLQYDSQGVATSVWLKDVLQQVFSLVMC